MNQDLFEVAAEINSKIGYDEPGNGAMRSFAAKAMIYQLRHMPDSIYNDSWYEDRKAAVKTYRAKIRERDEYKRTRRKRKIDDDANAQRAKNDAMWKSFGFLHDASD